MFEFVGGINWEMWVMVARRGYSIFSDGYFTGESYIHNGSRYAIVDPSVERAKKYTTYARCLSANKRMSFENYSFDIARLLE